jgi:hypothetical protein
MASAYLTRTPSSTGSQTKFTFSCWVKKCATGTNGVLYSCGNATSANYYTDAVFNSDDLLRLNWYNDSGNQQIRTNRAFRDTNGFYHIVIAWDTTQATASDRVKIYVNGVQETSFASATYPNQNQAMLFNTASKQIEIGRAVDGSNYFNGILSHLHVIDGTAYTPSAFGETDTTTGEWKAKTSPSVTYGTNGFFILKDGNSVTDQSGNGNNFTVAGGTLTDLKDNPDNTFATLNPLAGTAIGSYTNGNNRVVGVSTSWTTAPSTLAVSSGKFYCEAKAQHTSLMVGILDIDQMITNNFQGTKSNGWGYEGTGTLWNNGNPTTSWGSTYTTGDIIGIAMDLDNNKLYFSKNGTWQNSANPSAGTGGISITADKTYYFAMSPVDSTSSVIEANFGNGYFGTTAVSSAGTNASDNGIFEYDVPTGYTALSTKGLNL